MVELLNEYWWLIISIILGLFIAYKRSINFYKSHYKEKDKELSIRETIGITAIVFSVLILGISYITGIIDGKY